MDVNNRDNEHPTWETPNGKVLEVFPDVYGLYGFKFKSGGELPKMLKEKFTHRHLAEAHAERYIASKEAQTDAAELAAKELAEKTAELDAAKEMAAKIEALEAENAKLKGGVVEPTPTKKTEEKKTSK